MEKIGHESIKHSADVLASTCAISLMSLGAPSSPLVSSGVFAVPMKEMNTPGERTDVGSYIRFECSFISSPLVSSVVSYLPHSFRV